MTKNLFFHQNLISYWKKVILPLVLYCFLFLLHYMMDAIIVVSAPPHLF